ncbi:MAG: cold shock domain-containing protein [Candidatus Pacebacteria bacterium]|nr:cold shock domain-containing protein [Candidatus Paceibacterota bacterium]
MQKGTVARVMDKGFGFIAIEGREKDLFFHMNELNDIHFDDLNEGDALEFEIENGEKGENAVNISRA